MENTWKGAADWLRNNYHRYSNVLSICDAMEAAAPSIPAQAGVPDGIASIADELESEVMNYEGDFADTVRGCVDAMRELIAAAPSTPAAPVQWDETAAITVMGMVGDGPHGEADVQDALEFSRAAESVRSNLAGQVPVQGEREACLISRDGFYKNQAQDIAHALAQELEDAELSPNDYVTVNRAKLEAIADRVLAKARAALAAQVQPVAVQEDVALRKSYTGGRFIRYIEAPVGMTIRFEDDSVFVEPAPAQSTQPADGKASRPPFVPGMNDVGSEP